jgi:hypothetical protein
LKRNDRDFTATYYGITAAGLWVGLIFAIVGRQWIAVVLVVPAAEASRRAFRQAHRQNF